jgi:hypothetical protein
MRHELRPEANSQDRLSGLECALEQENLALKKRPSRIADISNPHRSAKDEERVADRKLGWDRVAII